MPQRFVVFFVFLLSYFMAYFLRLTNAVIAKDLTRDLSLSASQLGFMTSLFFIVFAAAQLPLGSALDRFGARRVIPLLMLASVLGSIVFGLAQSFAVLALGRALIGLGTAGNLMGALKSFSGWFESKQFAAVSSTYLALGSLGGLVAATPLAILSEQFGWRNVFFGGAAITFLSAFVIIVWGKDAPEATKNQQVAAQGSFADIFGDLRFWRIALLNFAVVGTVFAYQGLWAGPFLNDVMSLESVVVGNLLLVLSAGVSLGYLTSGFLGSRLGLAPVLITSVAVFAVLQGCLAVFGAGWPAGSLSVLFAGFGFSAASAVLMFAQIRAIFPLHLTGRAVTAVNLFGFGGVALLQWGLGILIGRFPQSATGSYGPEAYSAAFLTTALLCLATLIFYLPLLKTASLKRGL